MPHELSTVKHLFVIEPLVRMEDHSRAIVRLVTLAFNVKPVHVIQIHVRMVELVQKLIDFVCVKWVIQEFNARCFPVIGVLVRMVEHVQ